MARRPAIEETFSVRRETDVYTINGAVQWDLMNPKIVQKSFRSYSGTTTPGFKTLHRRALPFNSFALAKSLHFPGVARYHDLSPQPALSRVLERTIVQDPYNKIHSVDRSHLGEATDLAALRLAKQFNSVKTNVLLMFHERKKTADMIAKNAERIVRAALALKRLDFPSAYAALHLNFNLAARELSRSRSSAINRARSKRRMDTADDLLAKSWLELKYGWQPMLQDIYGAAEVLSESYRPESSRKYAAKASGSFSTNTSMFFSWMDFNGIKAGDFTKRTTSKILAIYSPDPSAKAWLHETGISNPALTLWDAVPFSFVVDWFLPVSGYLERLQAFSGFEFDSIRLVQFTKYSIDVKGHAERSGVFLGGNWRETVDLQYQETGIRYNRGTLASPPSVPLTFRDPVSVSHATSALALAHQIIGSFVRNR